MSAPLLAIENLSVAYPDQENWVLEAVSLTLHAGEKLGLVGESGCGKSTLGRAALRLLSPRARIRGQVCFNGESVMRFSPRRLRCFRGEAVALVFQDPMTRLDPLMTIGDHCIETLKAHRPELSMPEAKSRALKVLESVNIPAERFGQYPHEFSGGMRQRVAIALALLLEPQLIVADEPTTSLDVTISAQILRELTCLCEVQNTALLLISHDLALVAKHCDRVAVMYAGQLVETGNAQSVLYQPNHPYTQGLVTSAQQLHQGKTNAGQTPDSTPLLRLENVKQYYTLEANLLAKLLGSQKDRVIKAVDGVSLELFSGEVLGLVGESGCGKSTLSRTILQLVPPTSGRIEFQGSDLTCLSPQALRSQRRHMQMIFQDPHACLNPMMTVGRGIADPLLIHGLAAMEEAQTQTHEMLTRVGLHPTDDFYHRFPGDLSGGQQQRVAIARALITRPQLIICDEPVSMLDATVQAQVLELMLALKDEFDLTYLFITHDLWVARFMCDRIAVMQAGQIVELASTHQIFSAPQHHYTQTLLAAAPTLA